MAQFKGLAMALAGVLVTALLLTLTVVLLIDYASAPARSRALPMEKAA